MISLGQALTGPMGQFLVPVATDSEMATWTMALSATATHRSCAPALFPLLLLWPVKALDACRQVSDTVKNTMPNRAIRKRMRRERLKVHSRILDR